MDLFLKWSYLYIALAAYEICMSTIMLTNAPCKCPLQSLIRIKFNTYCSEEKILHHLCKARANLASKRNDLEFAHRINSSQKPGWKLIDGELDGLFPPRRKWIKFRPNKEERRSIDSAIDHNYKAILRCTASQLKNNPSASWSKNITSKIRTIKDRINSTGFKFNQPRVIYAPKVASDN